MRDHAGVTLAPDMFESEFGEFFQSTDIAKLFSVRCPFYLGEVFEPSDPAGSDWFVTVVGQHVRALVVVAVEEPFSLCTVLIQETDAPDSAGMHPLFGSRNDRKSKRIMTASFTLV
jgi:hypothetical protein